jgi:hypothetical protein
LCSGESRAFIAQSLPHGSMFGGMVVPERKKHLRPTQLRQWREYAGASQMEAAKAAGRTRLAVGLEAIENARKLSKKEFFYGYIEVAHRQTRRARGGHVLDVPGQIGRARFSGDVSRLGGRDSAANVLIRNERDAA